MNERMVTLVAVALALIAGLAGLALHSNSGFIQHASAASGCMDIDGDGVVHITDMVIWSNYSFQTVPPAPPQLDFDKNGSLSIGDQASLLAAFEASTACQTDPLPKTTLGGGALAVDANGENPVASDPVESTRTAVVGETFHVAIQVTSNPGIVAFQARLDWDEALLDLNPRTAAVNVVASLSPFGADLQVLGPAYVELGNVPYQAPAQSSTFVGPVAQLQFTCRAAGTVNATLAAGHSLLADVPSTEYTPTLTNAQIECVCPPEGCPVGGVAELPEVAGTPLEAPESSGRSVGVLAAVAAAVVGGLALGGGGWYARKRNQRTIENHRTPGFVRWF